MPGSPHMEIMWKKEETSMRVKNLAVGCIGFVLLSAVCLMAKSWKLPQGAKVKDSGPRTYRFTVDYSTVDIHGSIIRLQRVEGDYTRGLPDNKAIWENVTIAESNGNAETLGIAKKREFMNGFRYSLKAFNPLALDFFKGFPETAVNERNLVWDTAMFETFGQEQFERLVLNQPCRYSADQDVFMPGIGTFRNKNVQLTWVGKSYRNGQECALIEYNAYFNPLEIKVGNIALKGRSHYWGQIWVSLASKQIEYATLYEDVLGEMKLSNSDSPQIINVFRNGVFEPVTK
jgi:hypothetical protein